MDKKHFSELGFETYRQYRFPSIVNVCVLRGQCCCNCVHCPVGIVPEERRAVVFGSSVMDIGLFKKIVDELAGYSGSVLRIHSVGEPLLWKRISDAVRYASEKGVKQWLFTSLLTEDERLIRTLAEHCAIVEVSVNSTDRESYSNTKGVDGFERVAENLRLLRSAVSRSSTSARLLISRVQSDDPVRDEAFIRFWKAQEGLADDVFVRSYHDYNSLLEKRNPDTCSSGIQCLVHWNRFNIDTDGSAVVCFNELFKGVVVDSRLVYGNVRHETIANIWKGDKMNRVRLAQMKQDYSIVEFSDNLPCTNCYSCQPLHGKRPTSEYQIGQFSQTVA